MRQRTDDEWRLSKLARGLLSASVFVLTAGCTGILSNDSGGAASCAEGPCQNAAPGGLGPVASGSAGNSSAASQPGGPGEVAMRRLNNAEYANTLHDLFGSSGSKVVFPEEGRTEGFDTLNTALAISPIHIEAYLDAAEQVITELFDADPAGIRAAFCNYQSPDASANLACAQQIVTNFATRAWRRPLAAWADKPADAEYAALLQPGGALASSSLEQRLRAALQAILVSPRFIFRVELAGSDGKLDNPSLASRLSYFLWSSAPDQELLGSDLQLDASLEAEVTRMQAGERFQRFLQRFPDMWLELEKLGTVQRDLTVYPAYTPALVSAMRDETRQFFANYWQNPSGSLKGILLAPAAPANDAALSAIYGSSPRLGLITQAAIMTLTGATNRTSPVRRGKWVLERLLCDPPPPPPAGLVAALSGDLAADTSLTERERLARHRTNPICAACHDKMDPIGLGLENYDALGAYRTVAGSGKPVDASGSLPGSSAFNGALELIQLLAQDPRLSTCVARQLLTYGTGRPYTPDDTALLTAVSTSAGGADATFKNVLKSVVLSDAFRRRVEEK